MQFRKLGVAASVMLLAACGGEKAPETPPAQQAPAAAPAAAPVPITGTMHVVLMVGDEKGSRYEPATITIKAGDGIRFDGISLGPHNVSFDAATLSAPAKAALLANMPAQELGELSGKLVNNGEAYTVSFANVPPGTYEAICTPHIATNMKMKITVQ